MIELNEVQQTAVDSLAERETAPQTSFLLGAAGSGKTTVLQHRLRTLLQQGEPAYTILVLVAEPDHRPIFLDFLHQADVGPYAELKITTFNRMAQEMVALFWPLLARSAGFTHPYRPPTFLSYDLAQLLMWQVVTPLLQEGAFTDLRLRPQQIVSQLLDTLNRAALNALSLEEGIERQIRTWTGEAERPRHLEDAGKAAKQFRDRCLENSLLDLSLVIETFDTRLVRHPEFNRYFSERYRHLIVDNVEEQTPAGQNFIRQLMDATQTTTIAYDAGGGYKRFLAADPLGANQFRTLSQLAFEFEESFVAPLDLGRLANGVENYLRHTNKATAAAERAIVGVVNGRYRREMIANLIPLLHDLIHEEGVRPRDIAIITPYLDGALRYMLGQMLREAGLPYALLRRRSSPREEPRIRAWLTWLALAHPDWGIAPAPFDVAEALNLSLVGLDPARAALLTEQLYPYSVSSGQFSVSSEKL
ncbi:MAG: AAA family ATPase, partial [Chloroflexota bacterium]